MGSEEGRRAPLGTSVFVTIGAIVVLAAACTLETGDGTNESTPPPPAPQADYDPPWSSAVPARVIAFDHDPELSAAQNGAALKAAVQVLVAGDRLEIGSGVYSIDSFFTIDRIGTPDAPIWIAARAGATPVLTRVDAAQNAVNIGSSGPARYLVLEGLEIRGGDTGLRIHQASHVWIERCHVHDCAGPGITALSADTSFLYLLRNRIHHTAGTGEGMYLGANDGMHVTHDTTVALNHVHHTGGTQGDGIELKQGSWGNRIAENLVHDTPYPAILVYGTAGQPANVVERNVCYRSGDNVMQVQGEAIVRANLLVGGLQAFQSGDHQGSTRDLVVVHNTIVSTGRAANLQTWGGRPGMVFANNAIYSRDAEAVRFGSGSAGVALGGNVALGSVVGASFGFAPGSGLADFVALAWDASALDARPRAGGALIGRADPLWLVDVDLIGAELVAPYETGCLEAP
jgi:hypothetical protein